MLQTQHAELDVNLLSPCDVSDFKVSEQHPTLETGELDFINHEDWRSPKQK